jgi:hypothetical protein
MQNASSLNLKQTENSSFVFACTFILSAVLLAFIIGWQPLTLSIVTIFAFAGVHNFMEFRYFLARMPVRWGKSKLFYTAGFGGTLLLSVFYLSLYFNFGGWLWGANAYDILTATWNTFFILWLGLLFYLRGKQLPNSDWSWAFPITFLLAALAWIFPMYWALSMVYLHPFVAMWFLERQIRRTKKEWLKAYHFCLATIPFFVIILYFLLGKQPNLVETNPLFAVITNHAGSNILPNISSHFLVATHVFLETIHYSVWIILIPIIDKRAIPWRLKDIPFYNREQGFPKLVFLGLLISLSLVLVLWIGFSFDYKFTRDVYFAFAMTHVLAEMPFLIKMLA